MHKLGLRDYISEKSLFFMIFHKALFQDPNERKIKIMYCITTRRKLF